MIKKDFIVRRTITEIEGKPHVETYSEEELVRCKACEYWDYRTEGCMHLTGRIAPIVKTGADWFCADGRKRE